MFFRNVNKKAWCFHAVRLFSALLLMAAGSRSASAFPKPDRIVTPADLAAVQAKALQLNCPLLLLVVDPGSGRADGDARNAFESRSALRQADGRVLLAIADLAVSRARATAARFHPVETPLLVCLSPRGVVLSRSTKQVSKELVLDAIRQAVEESPETDRKLEGLEKEAQKSKDHSSAQMGLADFLMERNNALEAIPLLESVAHSSDAPTSLRIRAWADLVRAHFWIVESEKGRHEAEALIAELGMANPEARAAAGLVLGNQDAANPKRIERARKEFEEAVSAAPESVYGKKAAAALAKLAKGSVTQ